MFSKIRSLLNLIWQIVYSFFVSYGFKKMGAKTIIRPYTDLIVGKEYIEIGNGCKIGKHVQLTAWDEHNSTHFNPSIVIGNNCQFGGYNHITAINSIEIGNGVLTGKCVTITDNSHGKPGDECDCELSPIVRTVYSKGPVVIGDNVWIGDKATILPNVRIGEGCIIGANSVVTKDIPPYCIVGGNPARIIRQIK